MGSGGQIHASGGSSVNKATEELLRAVIEWHKMTGHEKLCAREECREMASHVQHLLDLEAEAEAVREGMASV